MDADPLIGTHVGNYCILSLIGRGGMGDVYRAVHVVIEARAAVKVLRATPASDAQAVERFMREAVAVNRIEHDRVIKITDAGQLADRRPYLVMELLEGRSLAERIGHRGDPLPLREAAEVAIDVLDVIAAAHASDIVHRDLKPGNIFLTASGRTVVLDFGVAHLIDPETTTLTRSGATLGTPLYMAPEQVSGDDVGPFTDVYAMGIVLYELVTGVRPFRAESTFALMRAQLEDAPPEPSLLAPELPRAVEVVILKALAKAPADRYADAAEMRDALRVAAASIAEPAPVLRDADPVADLAFGSSAAPTSSLAAEYLRAAEPTSPSPSPLPRAADAGPVEELSFSSSSSPTSSASSRSDIYDFSDFGVAVDAPTVSTASTLPTAKRDAPAGNVGHARVSTASDVSSTSSRSAAGDASSTPSRSAAGDAASTSSRSAARDASSTSASSDASSTLSRSASSDASSTSSTSASNAKPETEPVDGDPRGSTTSAKRESTDASSTSTASAKRESTDAASTSTASAKGETSDASWNSSTSSANRTTGRRATLWIAALAVVALGSYVIWRATRPAATPAGGSQVASGTGSARGEESSMASKRCKSEDGIMVCTRSGPIRGEPSNGNSMVVFRGVPYANPPVGVLRWKAPEPPAWSEGHRSRQSPRCAQWRGGAVEGDEDCLYLDIYIPPGISTKAKRQVIVFLHGGNHLGGAAADYDGRELARSTAAIVVIANYRLGAFGWLAHPALAEPGKPAGNYGMLDQIAALRWVRDEIAKFGGDPERITLLGQSAGAVDACNLLAAPAAAKLFSRLWLASGSCFALSVEQGATIGRAVAANLGCPDDTRAAACLRALPQDRLASAVGATSSDLATGVVYYPVIDGTLLPDAPLKLLRSGRSPRVPVVLGTTADEMLGVVDTFMPGALRDATDYAAAVERRYKLGAPTVLAHYPIKPPGTPRTTLAAVLSDELTNCPMRRTGRALAKLGHDVWRYTFAYRFREPEALAAAGAFHGIDLMFLFHDFRLKGVRLDPRELQLATGFVQDFTEFADKGVLASRPKLDASEQHTVWDDRLKPFGEPLVQPVCDRWDDVQDPP